VGGLCLICLLALLAVWLRKKKSTNADQVEMQSAHDAATYLDDSDGEEYEVPPQNSTIANTMGLSAMERLPITSEVIYGSMQPTQTEDVVYTSLP
jgi:hypothetical protein